MKVFFYDFFTEIKKCIFKKKWFVISIAISFVLGIILGIVLDKGITETYFNNESVIKYYTKIYSD